MGKKIINRILNILCLIVLIGITIYLIIRWNSIPKLIPSHYDFAGNVDSYGSKGSVLMMPILGWILYILVTVLEMFPGVWNTGVKVTEQNKFRVYAVLRLMMDIIKFIMVVSFSYITICMVEFIHLGMWFGIVEVGTIFLTIAICMVKLYKAQ
ncbi:MAG: DUF1648 domain-containing protein [Wujia sp.]